MRTSTWRGLVAPLTALLLVVAACGDDGDDTATDVVEASDAGDDDGDDEGSGEGSDAGDDRGPGDLALSGDFCADIAAAEDLFDNFAADVALQDPAQVSAAMRQAIDTIAGIDAPAAIRDDWALLIEAVSEVADLFDRVDFSDPQALEELAEDPELMAEFMGLEERFEGLEDAGDRVTDYVRDECGIELD